LPVSSGSFKAKGQAAKAAAFVKQEKMFNIRCSIPNHCCPVKVY